MAHLDIVLLGSPHLRHADGARHALERKDAALLALLALDGPTHRARASQLLWPDLSDKQARGNLRQRLFRLRQTARRELIDSSGLLRLLDDVTLDLALIHEQLATDATAAQGDLLGSHDYSDNDALDQWVQQARLRWHGTRLNLLAQVASDFEAKQQIAAALPYAQRMLAEDPMLEHAHRRLMRLHYLRGDRAAALAAYETCRQALGQQLGLRPSAETLELARLIESSGALSQPVRAPRPIATLRPPRMVGRDEEFRAVTRSIGEGRCVLVIGEPGIGKSRFIGELAAGTAVMCGALSGDARLPYALAGRLVQTLARRCGAPAADWACSELARIAPLLGAAPGGVLSVPRLAQALSAALADWRAAGLTLLAIDDLHFADEASLELLAGIVATLREARLPCLLTVRGGEMPVVLRAWLEVHDDTALQRVVLDPLDRSGVRELLRSLAIAGLDADAWCEPLARHTGGNPLFILETLIALLDTDALAVHRVPQDLPAPAQVGALIERRISQLSPGALKLARLAAVAGPDFDVELASRVLGLHALDIADHWHELEAAQVIRDDAFAHDLIREATLRSVPAAIARTLHREVAAHLQQRIGAPVRLAAHWEQAEDWAAAAAAYEAAAQTAMAAFRRADEASLWERAADCHERAGDRAGAFRAHCASCPAVTASRPIDEARALTERLLADAQGDAEMLDALLQRATLLLMQADIAAAQEASTRALESARRLALPWHEFEATRRVATSLAQQKRGGEGVELLGAFGPMVEADGSLQRRYDYWADMAYVLNEAGRRRESAGAWQLAAETAAALGDRHEAMTCTSNHAVMLVQLGRTEQAFEQAQRARRLHDEAGLEDDLIASAADMNIASFGVMLGHYEQSLALYTAALERFRKSNAVTWVAACENNLASTWLKLGQTARAMQALNPVAENVPPTTRARRRIIEGRIDRALGRSALPALHEALALLGERGDPYQRLLAELDITQETEPQEAAAQCRRCRERAESVELLGAAMKARLYEIGALLRGGAAGAAGALAYEIRPLLADCRSEDMHWPEALWLLVRAFDAAGDEAAALELLAEAAHWIRVEALPRVPEPFRDAFLTRQPVNQAVLAAADRRLR